MLPFPSHSFPQRRHPSSSLARCPSPCPHSLACRTHHNSETMAPFSPPLNFMPPSNMCAPHPHHTTPTTQTIPNIPSPDLKSTRLKPLRQEPRCTTQHSGPAWLAAHVLPSPSSERGMHEPSNPGANERQQRKRTRDGVRSTAVLIIRSSLTVGATEHKPNDMRTTRRANARTHDRAHETKPSPFATPTQSNAA